MVIKNKRKSKAPNFNFYTGGIGIGTTAPSIKLEVLPSFWYPPMWSWEVNKRKGKYYCDQISNERMRLGADGSLSFGVPAPMKSYEFLTREWAKVCKNRMEEMDKDFGQLLYEMSSK